LSGGDEHFFLLFKPGELEFIYCDIYNL